MASPEARSKRTLKVISEINARLERIETKLGIGVTSGPSTADAARLNEELAGEPTPANIDANPSPPKKGK